MKQKIYDYEGKKYILVYDGAGDECERCALKDQCHDSGGLICRDELGISDRDTTDHRLQEAPDDMLTDGKMFDDYQERTKTAGERANQLAWMFALLLGCQLIGGKYYREFYVATAGSIAYFLLSTLQSVWQGAAIWWFKNHTKETDTPTDYPEWIGGTAWVFYYMKMAVIAIASIYTVRIFLGLIF